MRIYSPTEWGARVNYDTWNDPFTPDDGVALHHGGGSDYAAAQPPYTLEKSAQLLRSWERYHLSRGWRGLAYGWGVDQGGRIFRIRGWNRYGAHLGDIDGDGIANNDEIVPIIWIASGNHHQMTEAADQAVQWLRLNVIQAESPNATFLWGHKEVQLDKPTSCPGPGGMAYVSANRQVDSSAMASPGQKLVVDLAFNLFPEEVQGDPNFWKDLPDDDPQWDSTFAPALSRGAQNLFSRSKSHPTEFRVRELIGEDPRVVRKGESVVIKGREG